MLRRSSRDALSITNSVFPSVRRPTPYTHHLTRSKPHPPHSQPPWKQHLTQTAASYGGSGSLTPGVGPSPAAPPPPGEGGVLTHPRLPRNPLPPPTPTHT